MSVLKRESGGFFPLDWLVMEMFSHLAAVIGPRYDLLSNRIYTLNQHIYVVFGSMHSEAIMSRIVPFQGQRNLQCKNGFSWNCFVVIG